jgi:hypothetical protein
MGHDNITLVHGDCLDPEVVNRVQNGTGVFCDPARPPGSSERTLDEIIPDPRTVMKCYGDRVTGFCFEVPPYLSRERIDFPCEAEYVSLDGRLNRLNLYTGDLARDAVSAVLLPSGRRVSGTPDMSMVRSVSGSGRYAHEADPALVQSGLLHRALEGIEAGTVRCDDRRTLILADTVLDEGLFGRAFSLLTICNESELGSELKRLEVGKVTIRFSIDPARYWEVRKKMEHPLSGDRKVHLFRSDRYYVLERVEG